MRWAPSRSVAGERIFNESAKKPGQLVVKSSGAGFWNESTCSTRICSALTRGKRKRWTRNSGFCCTWPGKRWRTRGSPSTLSPAAFQACSWESAGTSTHICKRHVNMAQTSIEQPATRWQ